MNPMDRDFIRGQLDDAADRRRAEERVMTPDEAVKAVEALATDTLVLAEEDIEALHIVLADRERLQRDLDAAIADRDVWKRRAVVAEAQLAAITSDHEGEVS